MTIKIISWNVNGIRAAAKNGFFSWLEHCNADIILLQEVRALTSQMELSWASPLGYKGFWHPAEKKGYSGVAILTRVLPKKDDDVEFGIGNPVFDSEGRFLSLRLGNVVYVSAYFPNSQREGARLSYKLGFCNALLSKAQSWVSEGLSVVIGGDFNIAHEEKDLANPKENRNSAGFLPDERSWLDQFVNAGFLDTFRLFESAGGQYTWWSNRPGIRQRNIGWRIDYHFVSKNLLSSIKTAQIHPNVFGSDHCPISLELEIS